MEPAPVWPPVRHPFQVSTFVAFTAIGFGFYGNPGVAIGSFLAGPWLYVWVTILFASGILGLIASMTAVSQEDVSLLTERIALVGAGSFCVLWAFAIFSLSHFHAVGGIIIFLGLATACWWRLRQVQKRVAWKKRRAAR